MRDKKIFLRTASIDGCFFENLQVESWLNLIKSNFSIHYENVFRQKNFCSTTRLLACGARKYCCGFDSKIAFNFQIFQRPQLITAAFLFLSFKFHLQNRNEQPRNVSVSSNKE